MTTRLRQVVGELDHAFYELCWHERACVSLLPASGLVALARAPAGGRALRAVGLVLRVLSVPWLVCRYMADGA